MQQTGTGRWAPQSVPGETGYLQILKTPSPGDHAGTQPTHRLRLFFLAVGDMVSARLAADYARELAGTSLLVEAAAFCPDDRQPSCLPVDNPSVNEADVIVVIDSRTRHMPVALANLGGRIDWHLPRPGHDDAAPPRHGCLHGKEHLTESLRNHVAALLGELGIAEDWPRMQ